MAFGAEALGGREGVALGVGAAALAVAGDVGAAVGEQDEGGGGAAAADLVGEGGAGVEAGGERGAAAAGEAGEAAAGANEGSGRWEEEFGVAAAEGDERDLVAADVALGEEELDGALGLGEAADGLGAGGVDEEDGGGLAAGLAADDAEVVGADFEAVLAGAEALEGDGGADRVEEGKAVAASWVAAHDAGGAAAGAMSGAVAGAAGGGGAALGGGEAGEEIGWQGG